MSGPLAGLVGIDVPTGLLIGGEWTGGRDGGTIAVIDPATEDSLTDVADGAATPPRQRAECLRRTFELMTEHADSLAA